jgi:hypothetical protein
VDSGWRERGYLPPSRNGSSGRRRPESKQQVPCRGCRRDKESRVRRSRCRARAARVRGRGSSRARRAGSPLGRDNRNRADLVKHDDDDDDDHGHVHNNNNNNNNESDHARARAAEHHPAQPNDHSGQAESERASALAALRFRSEEFKQLEIVVLRHELAVLRPQLGAARAEPLTRIRSGLR